MVRTVMAKREVRGQIIVFLAAMVGKRVDKNLYNREHIGKYVLEKDTDREQARTFLGLNVCIKKEKLGINMGG